MATAQYTVVKKDHHIGGPGDTESFLLEIAYDDDPVAAVTIEWHGYLELEFKITKFFGGKTPGIKTAWKLQSLVMQTITAHLEHEDAGFCSAFHANDRLVCSSHSGESQKADIPTFQPPT